MRKIREKANYYGIFSRTRGLFELVNMINESQTVSHKKLNELFFIYCIPTLNVDSLKNTHAVSSKE